VAEYERLMRSSEMADGGESDGAYGAAAKA